MGERDVSDSSSAGEERSPLSPALIATLIVVPVVVLAVFLGFAAFRANEDVATPIDAYATSAEQSERCGALIEKLPESFEGGSGFGEKDVDGDTVRWTAGDGDPLVLRCGVARPEALAPNSSLQVINDAQWFMADSDPGRGQAYVLVDRRPYVAVWVPFSAGNAPITDISQLAAQLLPSAPLDFGR